MEYRLEEIFDLQMGKTPSRHNQDYWNTTDNKWISIADLSKCGKYIESTKEYLSELAIEESGISRIPENTVIMSFKLSIGKTAITSEPMYSNEAIMSFRDKKVVDVLPDYIFYMFSGKDWDEGTNKAVMGKTLNKATLSKVKINIPEIESQQRAVEVLDKVSDIIADRKFELEELDNLIKSRFVELFGDPENNQYDWRIVQIREIIKSCESGWSGNGTQRQKKSGEVAVLKVSAVTKGYFIQEECKVLDDQNSIKKYVFPEKGDLLFSRANTREMVGATAVIQEDYPELILSDKLWKIRFLQQANELYMKHVLSHQSVRSKFSAASTGTSGSMFNVSMEKFKSLEIPLPPIELQNQFADFVRQVDKLKFVVQKSLDETQILFDSLMQKYFG